MFHIRIRPTALIVQDGKVLLIEYDDNGIHYNLPGGGAEPGETLIKGVKREVKEETTAEVDVGALAFVYEFAPQKQSGNYRPDDRHGIHFIFQCTLKEAAEPKLPQQPDCHQSAVQWMPIDELDNILLIPNLQQQIKDYEKQPTKVPFIEDHQLGLFL
ncbi:MAG TPA: NUDIX domain-containing protein [Bacillales bacterium]|nr:NUDIX domain-containing protein [Bacillales bacterium]